MKDTELRKELEGLHIDKRALLDEIIELNQRIAESECPFSIGDKIINKDGEKAVVAAIRFGGNWYEPFKAKKIKENGDPYINSFDVWTGGEWKLLEA